MRVLALQHVEVVESRVAAYQPEQRFDTVMSRAFSAIAPMLENTRHLIHSQGLWLAMKGKIPDNELKMLKQPYQIKTYTVPGVTGARCCILIEA